MYYMRRRSTIYRDYGEFGYITDNRNYGYRLTDEGENLIGDRVVSESGNLFLSVLKRYPKTIDELLEEISSFYQDVSKEELAQDSIEFYEKLVEEGFAVSGETYSICLGHDYTFSYRNKEYPINGALINKESIAKSKTHTQDFFEERFSGRPILTHVHIEITGRCNERCIHCYIPHENKTNEMDSAVFLDILNQCADLNVINLTISGGEPLSHSDLIPFLQKCNDLNFSVNILSNLTKLSDSIILEMKNNPLICVQTSIYSMDPAIHDKITQVNGSLEKTLSSVQKLIDNDIPLQVSCPIMKDNYESFYEVMKWGQTNGIAVSADYVLIGSYDHSLSNLDCRLAVDDIKTLIRNKEGNDPAYNSGFSVERKAKKPERDEDYICSVCHSSICISENGDIYPCPGWQGYVLGNVRKNSISDVWYNSPQVKQLRDVRREDFPMCISCEDKDYCSMCLVRNANEDVKGNYMSINKFFCDVAKATHEVHIEQINGCNNSDMWST